jgi:hypothetical protein
MHHWYARTAAGRCTDQMRDVRAERPNLCCPMRQPQGRFTRQSAFLGIECGIFCRIVAAMNGLPRLSHGCRDVPDQDGQGTAAIR